MMQLSPRVLAAGPTMLALGPADADLKGVGESMTAAFAAQGIKSRSLVLPISMKGAEVLP